MQQWGEVSLNIYYNADVSEESAAAAEEREGTDLNRSG